MTNVAGTPSSSTKSSKGSRVDSQQQQASDVLSPGTVAPDFTLHVTMDQTISLAELRGRPVILAFYPADWSPVCGDQMALYNEILPEFQSLEELVGL